MPQGVLPGGAHWLLMHTLPDGQHCWLQTWVAGQQRPVRHCDPA